VRFCPFCAAENGDEATQCVSCAQRLPRSGTSSLPPAPPVLPDGDAGATAPAFPPPPPPLPRELTQPPFGRDGVDPTPTHRVDPSPALAALRTRTLSPVPEPPESGLFGDARYVLALVRARWERRRAVKGVDGDIQKDVAALDELLGELGRAGRGHGLTSRPFGDENGAIDAAKARADAADKAISDGRARVAEEDTRFAATEKDLERKLAASEEAARDASAALAKLEEERRALREQKKQVDARQKQFLKSAEDREAKATKMPMGDERASLRSSSEELRSDAARVEPERADLERKLAALESPLEEASAHDAAARADLEATRKAKGDARAGHRHRHAELEAEAARQERTRGEATGEVARRLVTLGTLLNLNRVVAVDLDPLYLRVDALRTSISTREKEIENLRAEASRADPRAVTRGAGVLFGVLVLLITLVCVILSLR
jgi:hypothetical protein